MRLEHEESCYFTSSKHVLWKNTF